jgi:hypothetical protein
MNPSRLVQKLTDEIVNKFRLPKNICYAFIKKRITWAFVAGWELGRKVGKRSKPVIQLDKYGKVVAIFAGLRNAARAVHGDKSHINKVIHGKKHSCKGYFWRVIDDPEEAEKILEKWQEEL